MWWGGMGEERRRSPPSRSNETLARSTRYRPAVTPWHRHPYNRAAFYRLAETMRWVPRTVRLVLARRLGHLALHRLPAERAVVRRTLGIITGASGRRLDELTAGVFRDFAMCFSDLVSTNRLSTTRLGSYVASVEGAE